MLKKKIQTTGTNGEIERENSPSDSNKNSRALPLSHLIVGRISKTCFEKQIPNSKIIFMKIQAKTILDLLMNLNGNLDTFLPWVHLSFGYSLITDLKKILDLYLFINTTKVYRHTKLASFEKTNSKHFRPGTFIEHLTCILNWPSSTVQTSRARTRSWRRGRGVGSWQQVAIGRRKIWAWRGRQSESRQSRAIGGRGEGSGGSGHVWLTLSAGNSMNCLKTQILGWERVVLWERERYEWKPREVACKR